MTLQNAVFRYVHKLHGPMQKIVRELVCLGVLMILLDRIIQDNVLLAVKIGVHMLIILQHFVLNFVQQTLLLIMSRIDVLLNVQLVHSLIIRLGLVLLFALRIHHYMVILQQKYVLLTAQLDIMVMI